MSTIIKAFTFSPFQENTYVISTPEKDCIIIDPGCYDTNERQELKFYIEQEKLTPKHLLNTHAHIDHVFGNDFVAKEYNLTPQLHPKAEETLLRSPQAAMIWNLNFTPSPTPEYSLKEEFRTFLPGLQFEILFVPGHSPGHVAFVNHQEKYVIGGDVLFNGSIGRTDLPGGSFEVLEQSIQNKMYSLPHDYTVYSGHGPATTIGKEKESNPFVKPLTV